MNNIAKFFTLYWIIYFPTCIAFNDQSGFSSVDEVMTIVLIAFTLLMKWSPSTNQEPWKEYFTFLGILAFYVVYSLQMNVNVNASVWYDLIQQIRPFSIIYCTWILNPQFSEEQKKWMIWTMILTLLVFIYTVPTVGVVRNAHLGQMTICTAMTYYLFKEKSQKTVWITTGIATIGLLSMKFKYYGEYGVFIAMLFFLREKLNFRSSKARIQIFFLILFAIFLGWDRFDTYYVSGLDNNQLARPMMYKTAFSILTTYFPFGSGMGTFGTAASAVYYSPLYYKYGLNHVWGLTGAGGFIGDTFYPSLAEFGVVGIILYFVFWKRRLTTINQIDDMRYYLVGFMSFFCLAIEQTADSSWLSGKGMGYCMLIGLCLNANLNRNEDEEDVGDDGNGNDHGFDELNEEDDQIEKKIS